MPASVCLSKDSLEEEKNIIMLTNSTKGNACKCFVYARVHQTREKNVIIVTTFNQRQRLKVICKGTSEKERSVIILTNLTRENAATVCLSREKERLSYFDKFNQKQCLQMFV